MFAVLGQCLRIVLAAAHTLCGWLAFRLGSSDGARRHFERALALGGNEFTAYVHLGRIALRDGDYAGYRREMANARAIAPDRFARLRPQVEGLEPRVDGAPHDETGERATWRSVRQSGSFLRRTVVHSTELPTEGFPADGIDELLQRTAAEQLAELERALRRSDDFSSHEERARFLSLPPIQGDEIKAADLDDLLRRLSG